MNKTFVYGGILVAIVIAVSGLFYPHASSIIKSLGGVTNYDEVDATAIKVGGSSGSRVGPIITGTCSLIRTTFVTLAASSTLVADCAVTGVVTGDIVYAQFATTTNSVGEGWVINQVSASTTAGFITIDFSNHTGTTATIPASVASTTEYTVLHPVTAVPGL